MSIALRRLPPPKPRPPSAHASLNPGAGLYIDSDYLVTGEQVNLRENGAISGVGMLATFAYDDQGRQASLTRGNGAVTIYGFDAVSRLAS